MKYQNYIFDLYGTLVDIHTDEGNLKLWRKMAAAYKKYGAVYTPAKMRKTYELLVKEAQKEVDEILIEPVFEKMFTMQNVTVDDETVVEMCHLFRKTSTEYIRLYPKVLESLDLLRKKGYRLWLLSNAQEVFTRYELRHLGLWAAFDGIYISSSFGFRKPDVRFFRSLLEEQQLDPKQCLMIGNDRETDIAGAKAAGLDTFYMHTALTPNDQSPADPENPMEFEGDDWERIVEILCKL